MRNWLQRVMAGRYGVDEYSRFLNIVALVSLVLSILFNNGLSVFFLAVGHHQPGVDLFSDVFPQHL